MRLILKLFITSHQSSPDERDDWSKRRSVWLQITREVTRKQFGVFAEDPASTSTDVVSTDIVEDAVEPVYTAALVKEYF